MFSHRRNQNPVRVSIKPEHEEHDSMITSYHKVKMECTEFQGTPEPRSNLEVVMSVMDTMK